MRNGYVKWMITLGVVVTAFIAYVTIDHEREMKGYRAHGLKTMADIDTMVIVVGKWQQLSAKLDSVRGDVDTLKLQISTVKARVDSLYGRRK